MDRLRLGLLNGPCIRSILIGIFTFLAVVVTSTFVMTRLTFSDIIEEGGGLHLTFSQTGGINLQK